MRNIIFAFSFFLFTQTAFAQSIEGKIKNEANTPVENASISFWNSEKKEKLLGYCYSDSEGYFNYTFNTGLKTIFVEVSSFNYKSVSRLIDFDDSSKMKSDFILEQSEIKLEEVVVKEEKKGVKVKNDSVFYDPQKFLDGTERKVEDLLKKLPGISVNENTGEIKYKGKSIETVKLENDDLFGGNYSLGTKNISVDMVEQVQAIENYSSNPLLKGIENSDKVVLNLKLKSRKTDYSGNAKISNGYSNKFLFDDEVDLLGISKKIKSFGFLSYNNYGTDVNNLTGSFGSVSNNEVSSSEFYAKKNIYESLGNIALPASRTKFNNTFFSNYNVIFKLSPKLSLKTNLIYYKDRTDAFEYYMNKYFLDNGDKVENTQENHYYRKPDYYNAEMRFTYNVNKTSLLTSDLSFKDLVVNSGGVTTQNIANTYNGNLHTNDLFLRMKTEYTVRVSEKTALQFLSILSKNSMPQELIMSPGNNFITGINSSNSVQESGFEKQVFYNRLTVLKGGEKSKQLLSVGYLLSKAPFKSALTDDGVINEGFVNDMVYKRDNWFGEYSSAYTFGKFKLQPYFNISYYRQSLENSLEKTVMNKNGLGVNANLQASYRISSMSSFYLNEDLRNSLPSEDYLYNNNVLLSPMVVKKNIPSLNFTKNDKAVVGYKYDNLFKQITLWFNLEYSKVKNTFLSYVNVEPNFSSFVFFQNPTKIETKGAFFSLEKQVIDWRVVLKHTSSFNLYDYVNAVDNVKLRQNKSNIYNGYLFFTTVFNLPVNFENSINYSFSAYESDNVPISKRASITNTFRLVFQFEKNLNFTISQDYYITDTRANNNFSFLDFVAKYRSSKYKWLTIDLIGKNLFNTRTYNQVYNSDYSYSVYKSYLIPRYFSVSMNVNF